MSGKSPLVASAIGAVLLLAGCSSAVRGTASPDPAMAPPEASSSAPSSPQPEEPGTAEVNARGNIEKEVGEPAGVTGDDGEPLLTFTVDEIVADYTCTGDLPEPAENGHFVALRMTVETAPNLPPDAYYDISAYEFSFIGGDGVTFTEVDTFAAFICAADDQQLPSGELGSGQRYTGTLVLDVPGNSGIVQYQPFYLPEGGWEWEF
ncbi:hypothetical protein ACI797_01980 [Geodermatophilus sp. SYSU D00691]